MADRSKPKLILCTRCGGHIFAFEEYWTEDNDGFCSTDFLWEKHTRLKVFSDIPAARNAASAEELAELLSAGQPPVQIFDFDSGQREKEILADEDSVQIIYWPSYQTRRQVRLQAGSLEILEDKTEHDL